MSNKLCECGCGKNAPIAKATVNKRGWKKGEPVRFICGHNNRGKTGSMAMNWKNGKTVVKGYTLIYQPDHHRSNPKGYVPEHVLVMEASLGRKIMSSEAIHHFDGDGTNNHIGNLMLFANNAMHTRYHAVMRKGVI